MTFEAFATLAYWLSVAAFVLFVLLLGLEAYLKEVRSRPGGPQAQVAGVVNPVELAEALAKLLEALEKTRPAIAALATSMLFFGLGLLSLYLGKSPADEHPKAGARAEICRVEKPLLG